MTIEIVDSEFKWESFVNGSPHKTLFHSWKLLKIVEKYSGYTFLPYGIFDKEKKLISIFPVFFQERMGIRFLFSQPPMSNIPFTGLMMNSDYTFMKQRQKESCLNKVILEISTEINKMAPHYVSISLGYPMKDVRPFLWNGFDVSVGYTYLIDLHQSLDNIWNSFDRNCRREIRTTETHNLSIKETSKPSDVEQFYTIMQDRYHQQNLSVPLYSSEYLKDIVAVFPDNVKLYSLYESGVVIDMVLLYEYDNYLGLWMGGINLDKSIHSNEYLTWEFIKQAKAKGYDVLENHGADVQRLSLFKSKFNPRLEHNFHVHKKYLIGKCAEWVYINLVKTELLA
jgi:hypothetical protein